MWKFKQTQFPTFRINVPGFEDRIYGEASATSATPDRALEFTKLQNMRLPTFEEVLAFLAARMDFRPAIYLTQTAIVGANRANLAQYVVDTRRDSVIARFAANQQANPDRKREELSDYAPREFSDYSPSFLGFEDYAHDWGEMSDFMNDPLKPEYFLPTNPELQTHFQYRPLPLAMPRKGHYSVIPVALRVEETRMSARSWTGIVLPVRAESDPAPEGAC